MKVALDSLGAVGEPYLEVYREHDIRLALRPGFIELGSHRSAIKRETIEKGEVRLFTRHFEKWIGSADLQVLSITIPDTALMSACDAMSGEVELRRQHDLMDARVVALVSAVNAERVAGFPSGRLFLDSVEQALAVALVDGYAVRRPSPRIYRGGLTPARLRRVTELVDAKIDDDLTLEAMAESVGLSIAHFSQMFRKSTGQSPHQFVLRHRVEHAKEILRTGEWRVLDVAVACGFKTQQHFARVFRQLCGISPTEYRQRFIH
ncbi:MAG TPA: AraC family transcriptional regulator [Blastocatellia bacterium]|nr:AraC family transcriptional regulator [Blastocatellia bacterium]